MRRNRTEKALIGVALASILLGLLCVLPIANITLHQHGKIEVSPLITSFRLAISLAGILLIAWGTITLVFRQKEAIVNLNVFFATTIIVSPVLMEIVLRTGIAFGPSVFRTPELYSSPYSDNDYFKLRTIWRLDEEESNTQLSYDPLLGWAYEKTSENPLGVLTGDRYTPDPMGTNILFYGDSFVEHGERMADKIPQQLDRLLPEHSIYNYGVPGFGLDQIYLRFKHSHHHFDKPFIIIGVMTADIDRCILQYRNRPKPYFVIEQNALELKGVPVERTRESYLRKYPLSIRSYFGATLVRVVRYLEAGGVSAYSTYNKTQKEQINRKIIEQIVDETRKEKLDVLFVVFVQAIGGGWRKTFLIDEINRWGVPYIDTEIVLLQTMPSSGNFSRLYYDETGHHNTLANSIIADAIAERYTET